jgi:hypothetical protein
MRLILLGALAAGLVLAGPGPTSAQMEMKPAARSTKPAKPKLHGKRYYYRGARSGYGKSCGVYKYRHSSGVCKDARISPPSLK